MADQGEKEKFVLKLFELQGIKVQDVVLKTGIRSPIYIDLRVIVSHPDLLKTVANLMKQLLESLEPDLKFNSICGVPYTALPIATAVCLATGRPMVMRRKESKSYGTKRMIEGAFKEQDIVLVVEDVITSGTSILETVNCLTQNKLTVRDAVIVLDRNQDGLQNLHAFGIRVHSILDMDFVLKVLSNSKKLAEQDAIRINEWLVQNPARLTGFSVDQYWISKEGRRRIPFGDRSKHCSNILTARILETIEKKKSNLCLAVDCETTDQVLAFADLLGPHIVILKLHADILNDFSQEFVLKLKQKAEEHSFFIFEDKKFADIGNTVRMQYSNGIQISDWADLITCHVIPGEGVIRGLKAGLKKQLEGLRGSVLIAEMSCEGNLLKQDAVESAHSLAHKHSDFVVGFICQSSITSDRESDKSRVQMIHMTPGVSLQTGTDGLGQRYLSPKEAIEKGADVVIVGRAVTSAATTQEQERIAIEIKEQAFTAYMKQCNAYQ